MSQWGYYKVSEKNFVKLKYEPLFQCEFRASCAGHALSRALKRWSHIHRRFHHFGMPDWYHRPCSKEEGYFEVYDIRGRFFYYYQ